MPQAVRARKTARVQSGLVDGDHPQRLRSVDVQVRLTLPSWAIVELEHHSTERPGESLDGFLSGLVRQWAERRQAGRFRPDLVARDRR